MYLSFKKRSDQAHILLQGPVAFQCYSAKNIQFSLVFDIIRKVTDEKHQYREHVMSPSRRFLQMNRRRDFFRSVGQGMLVAGLGFSTAFDLGLSPALGDDDAQPIDCYRK